MRTRRNAYTLIELIVAMAASAVLLLGMAGTVVIALQLFDVPAESGGLSSEYELANWLAADLRYATNVQIDSETQLSLVRHDVASGVMQNVVYKTSADGLLRQVGGAAAVKLAETPSSVDTSVIEATLVEPATEPSKIARCRAISRAANWSTSSGLSIELPAGCVDGDLLLLCVSGKNPDSFTVSNGVWQTIHDQSAAWTRQTLMTRAFDASLQSPVLIQADRSSSIAATIVAIENAQSLDLVGSDQSSLWWQPKVLLPQESPDASDQHLHLQFVTAASTPWHHATLGLAGYGDLVQVSAIPWSNDWSVSIGVGVRNGASPPITGQRVWFDQWTTWLHTSVVVEPRS